jgi:hypothetical protein
MPKQPNQPIKTKFEKDQKRRLVTGSSLLGAGAGAASTPSLVNAARSRHFVNIDKASDNLVIFSEGGKYNTGGSGHSAVAKAIEEAHLRKHPGAKVKTVNYGDYARLKNLAPAARTSASEVKPTRHKFLYKTKKFFKKDVLFGITGGPMHASANVNRMAREVKKFRPGRAVVTHPGTASFAHRMGIRPELAITDYGVNSDKDAKGFWNMARGIVKKPKDPLSAVHYPSEEGRELFKDLDAAKRPISSIPLEKRHLKKPEKINTKITREFERFDSGKKSTGRISVPAGKKLVVIQGGGTGQNVDQMAKTLLRKQRKDVFYVGVAGKNKAVLKQLQELEKANPGSFASTGFAMNLDKLNRQSHVTVARPHGISTTEIGASGTPNINVVRERHITRKDKKPNRGRFFGRGRKKIKEYQDSYAGHMVGNAKHYRERAGSPIAHLTTVAGKSRSDSNSLNRHLDDVLLNHKDYSNRAKKWSKEIRKGGGAAKQIVDSANTSYSKFKGISRKSRGLAYVTAAGLAAGGAHQLGKFFKAKTEAKIPKL